MSRSSQQGRVPEPRKWGLGAHTEVEGLGRTEEPLGVFGLFAGIGGIELGLAKGGGHVGRGLCEIDPAARRVLEKEFSPPAQGPRDWLQADVTAIGVGRTAKKRIPRGTQLITAGFPCQDLSQAGATAGLGGERSSLIQEVLRLLRERIEARRAIPYLLLENVPFMLQLGRGAALDTIIGELESMGYRWAYRVVDTRSFGIPQRRFRVFLLASWRDALDPRRVLFADEAGPQSEPVPNERRPLGFYWTEGNRGLGAAADAVPTLKGGSTIGIPSPPAIVLPDGATGKRVVTPDIQDAERLQGFEAGWTESAKPEPRGDALRWKLVGNAVTVDVAKWIGARLACPAASGEYAHDQDVPIEADRSWPVSAWGDERGRWRAMHVTRWPFPLETKPLQRFLEHEPKPLSLKATSGILFRLERSGLASKFPWMLDALREHRQALIDQG